MPRPRCLIDPESSDARKRPAAPSLCASAIGPHGSDESHRSGLASRIERCGTRSLWKT